MFRDTTDFLPQNINFRLLSGQLGVVAGTPRESLSPVRHGSLCVHLTRLRALCQGTPATCCVVLQVTFQGSSRDLLVRMFRRVLSSELVERKQKKYEQQPTQKTPRGEQTSYLLDYSLNPPNRKRNEISVKLSHYSSAHIKILPLRLPIPRRLPLTYVPCA